MKCISTRRPGSVSSVPSRNPSSSGAASLRLYRGEPQQPAKKRCTPGLDSQLERRSCPESNASASAFTAAVVPKLEPECLRQRQQWQWVTGPISSPRIA